MKALYLLAAAVAMGQIRELPLPPGTETAVPLAPANLDFEKGTAGGLPAEWNVAQTGRLAGYTAEWRGIGCRSGGGCVQLTGGPRVESNNTGVLTQEFSAEPYRGKRMRLRAWVRLEAGKKKGSIRVAFATSGERGEAEFWQKGRVESGEWMRAEVEGKVPMRADEISMALTLSGQGTAWFDDVTFEEVR